MNRSTLREFGFGAMALGCGLLVGFSTVMATLLYIQNAAFLVSGNIRAGLIFALVSGFILVTAGLTLYCATADNHK